MFASVWCALIPEFCRRVNSLPTCVMKLFKHKTSLFGQHYERSTMKEKLLLIPLAGGILAILSLFLPWVKFASSLIPHEVGTAEVITYSGFEINGLFVTLALIAALAISGVSIYNLNQKTPWKSRIPALRNSIAGLLCVVLTLILYTQSLNSGIEKVSDLFESTIDFESAMNFKEAFEKAVSLQFGGFGAAIGFTVAIIGACSLPKSDPSMENSE